MKGRKSIVLMLSIFTLVLSVTMGGMVRASPEWVVEVLPMVSSANPTETFSVIVMVSGAYELFLAEFNLTFDPDVLYCSDTLQYDFEEFYVVDVDNNKGIAHLVAGRPTGVEDGLSGTVGLAEIVFQAEAAGECALHFSDLSAVGEPVKIKDVFGANIYPTPYDGFFDTYPGDTDGDHDVDLDDLYDVIVAYGSVSGGPGWNPDADVYPDGEIDLYDLVTVCLHYGA